MTNYSDFYDKPTYMNEKQNIYIVTPLKRYYTTECSLYDNYNYFIEEQGKVRYNFIKNITLSDVEEIYFNVLKIKNLEDLIEEEIIKDPQRRITYFILHFNKDNLRYNFHSKELDEYGGIDNFINKRKLQQKLNNF